MNLLSRALLLGCALLFSAPLLRADGIVWDQDGRYTGGPVVVLRLTDQQKTHLAQKPKSRVAGALRLTPEQAAELRKRFAIEATLIEVYDNRTTRYNDCTCHLVNTAFRFDDDHVEVPQAFLNTDKDALDFWKALDEPAAKP